MTRADLRFPVGEFYLKGVLTAEQREEGLDQIENAPTQLREAVSGLSGSQLETPYRPDGWTVRQVVHHVPNSHVNGYIRLKLALTETTPAIRTYDQDKWAELPDAEGPVAFSLDLIDALHVRWIYLFRRLKESDWNRRFRHPDFGEMRVDELLAYYAWHGRHHIAHITGLRKRQQW